MPRNVYKGTFRGDPMVYALVVGNSYLFLVRNACMVKMGTFLSYILLNTGKVCFTLKVKQK